MSYVPHKDNKQQIYMYIYIIIYICIFPKQLDSKAKQSQTHASYEFGPGGLEAKHVD